MNLTKTTKILLVASSLWYFGEGLFGPLFAIYAEKIGGNLLDITWAWALYLISTGIFYVIVGRYVNQSKYKKHVMIFGYALNACFTFGYMFIENANQIHKNLEDITVGGKDADNYSLREMAEFVFQVYLARVDLFHLSQKLALSDHHLLKHLRLFLFWDIKPSSHLLKLFFLLP